jgi:hypothetical protein
MADWPPPGSVGDQILKQISKIEEQICVAAEVIRSTDDLWRAIAALDQAERIAKDAKDRLGYLSAQALRDILKQEA